MPSVDDILQWWTWDFFYPLRRRLRRLRRIWDYQYYVDTEYHEIDKVADPSALAEIAQFASKSESRSEAIKKVVDQVVLAKVARSDSAEFVRIAALEKISDEVTLAGGLSRCFRLRLPAFPGFWARLRSPRKAKIMVDDPS